MKTKLFLKEFSFEAMKEALEGVLSKLGSSYVDSLQVTVPYAGQRHLAIAEEEKDGGPEYEENLQRLMRLWRQMEVNDQEQVMSQIVSFCYK